MVRTVTDDIRAMGVRAVNESNALRTQKLEYEAEIRGCFSIETRRRQVHR